MRLRFALLASLACALPPAVQAQDAFPAKPVHIIVGFAAGGGNDIIVRVLAPKMSEGLGQPIIIENRPGAQNIIAAEYVAKAAPDGYTLLMGPSGAMTMNPAIYSKLSYAPLTDFIPISMIGDFPLLLVVSASLPVKSVKELIDYARANPSAVNYSASAAPFQLAAELFNQKTGTKFAYIPYKSSGDSVAAVMSGQVTLTITDPPPVIGPLKGGRVRALAVTASKRDAAWPEVPTLAEAGVPGYEASAWNGVAAPAKTPRAVIERLNREINAAVAVPEVRQRLQDLGVDARGSSPEAMRELLVSETAKWKAVVERAKIEKQ